MVALFWDRRRPRLLRGFEGPQWQRWQARTPAVPEERAPSLDVA